MSIFSRHFPLGLGTSRFPISGPDDTEGIEKSIKLVSEALESGITKITTNGIVTWEKPKLTVTGCTFNHEKITITKTKTKIPIKLHCFFIDLTYPLLFFIKDPASQMIT